MYAGQCTLSTALGLFQSAAPVRILRERRGAYVVDTPAHHNCCLNDVAVNVADGPRVLGSGVFNRYFAKVR